MSHDWRVFDVGGQRSLVSVGCTLSTMIRLMTDFFLESRMGPILR